jgi:hypothetical protein
VGHSSGCAVSDAIAEKITDPNHAELINLEGFRPSTALQKRMKTLCVYSDTTLSKNEIAEIRATHPQNLTSAGQLVSGPAGSMKLCKNSMRMPVHHCKSTHCLHFSLVNRTSPDSLGYDYPLNGYKGCYANLTYLPEMPTQTADGEYDNPPPTQQQQRQDDGASS